MQKVLARNLKRYGHMENGLEDCRYHQRIAKAQTGSQVADGEASQFRLEQICEDSASAQP